MAPLRDSSDMPLFATGVRVGNQSHVIGQFIDRGKPTDFSDLRQQDHGRQRTDSRNGPQQQDPGPVLLCPGQGQDGTVQLGNDLAQMTEFLQMDLKRHIPAGPLHSNAFDPSNKASRPMTHLLFLWNHHPIKEKHGFNLVLAPRLLPNHAQSRPDQTAILQLPSRRNVDPFEISIAKTPGKLSAIDPIPLRLSLFVLGRHIRRVYHQATNPLFLQLVMNPKTAITRFIRRVILTPWEMVPQVMNQLVHFRRLAKVLILTICRRDTHAPTLLVDIQTHVDRLTRKIKFVTLNSTHGKPPFGKFLLSNKNYTRNWETCLFFNTFAEKNAPVRKLST